MPDLEALSTRKDEISKEKMMIRVPYPGTKRRGQGK